MNSKDYCVDREIETKDLMREIYDSSYTTIKFLYSASAVGKSTFTDRIKNEVDQELFIPICIRTVPENEGNKYKEWEVFLLLFEKVNQLSLSPANSLTSFRSYYSKDNILMEESVKQAVQDAIKKPDYAAISLVAPALESVTKTHYNSIVLDDSLLSMKVKKNYLKYIFSNFRVLLIIDNVQNIDNMSLKNIMDIIHETKWKNHFVLMEYTLTISSTTDTLNRLIKYIKNYDIQTDMLKINQIPRDYIIDIVAHSLDKVPDSYELSKQILNFYDNQDSGNLWQIISFAENYLKDNSSSSNDSETQDQILKKILALHENSILILAFIIHNNGKLKKDILKIICPRDISSEDLAESYKELAASKFIESSSSDYLCIRHASTIDSWKSSKSTIIRNADIIARNAYEKHYLSLLKRNNISESQITEIPWLALLEIYKLKYPEKIYSLIGYLRKGILTNVSPETAWIFLKAFIDKTYDEISLYKNSYYDILNLCFEFELYKEGYECIAIMETQDKSLLDENRLLFYKMLYLSALDKHEQNIELFKKNYHKYNTGSREFLIILIAVQSSFKSLNKIQECLKIYHHIQTHKQYKKYDEYGYFLRITDMYLPRRKALRLMKKSYHFFEKRGNRHQAGKSAISAAHIISSMGNTKKGLDYIHKAEILLNDKQMGQHMLLVNKAVIYLHSGIFTDEVWDWLDMAELSARVPFDRLAIQLCKLVWYMLNNKYENCSLVINKIEEYTKEEPDKSIVAMAYYDLYYYYNQIGAHQTAQKYKQLAIKLKDWCPIAKAKLEHYIDKEYKFVLQKDWGIYYLEYWTFDLLLS